MADWQPSNEEYHANHKWVSNSMKETLINKGPAVYAGRYVLHTLPPRKETPALRMGILTHLRILEPDELKRIAMPPLKKKDGTKLARASKKDKEAWAEYEALIAKNKQRIVTADELKLLDQIYDGVMRSRVGRLWLAREGRVEHTVTGKDPVTGLAIKMRWDKEVVHPDAGPVLLDLKSSLNPFPTAFAKSCSDYGYHRQDDFYSRAYEMEHGVRPKFLFIVFPKEAPFEDVGGYEIEDDGKKMGKKQNDQAMNYLADSYATSDWTSPHTRSIQKLSLPRWSGKDFRIGG